MKKKWPLKLIIEHKGQKADLVNNSKTVAFSKIFAAVILFSIMRQTSAEIKKKISLLMYGVTAPETVLKFFSHVQL